MDLGVIQVGSTGSGNAASATQRTYLSLRRLIVTGAVKPGEKLKIEGLRTRLQTGASPIREALSLLTSEHLVERIDQRGFRAAPTSRENFDEILEMRCELEGMALRRSIASATEDWEEAVVLAHHRMGRAAGKGTDNFEDEHKAFHMTLLANCGAPILLRFCSQLYDLNIRYRYLAGRALDYQKRDVGQEHREILERAVARDADGAEAELLGHYRRTGAFLADLMTAQTAAE
ncbi:GntR family transcriptional regulator [Jannaschia sp. 2305UL9-9]|uniref:GntR family transcriptional regulator n=1 Tax=Jannaschia sp. 2305UL9-9 TaxID=3121638 RepID=UPI003527ED10